MVLTLRLTMSTNRKYHVTTGTLVLSLLHTYLHIPNLTQQPLPIISIKPIHVDKYQIYILLLLGVQESCGPRPHVCTHLRNILLGFPTSHPTKTLPVLFGPRPPWMGTSNTWTTIPHMEHNPYLPSGIHKIYAFSALLDCRPDQKPMVYTMGPMTT